MRAARYRVIAVGEADPPAKPAVVNTVDGLYGVRFSIAEVSEF